MNLESRQMQGRGLPYYAVEQLLDTCPELFTAAEREFNVAEVHLHPHFKVVMKSSHSCTQHRRSSDL